MSEQPPGWGPAARFLAATTISYYGDWFSTVAVIVLLYRQTGSAAAPAGYVVARVAPRLFGSVPGGVLADRFSPAHVVAATSLLQGLLTLSILGAATHHLLWAIYAAVALAQLTGSLARPSHGALMPRLAPAGGLGRLNALYGTGLDTSIFVAPALATPALAYGGVTLLLVADAVSFVVAAALALTLSVRPAAGTAGGPALSAAAEGLRLVGAEPFLRTFAAAGFAGGLAVTALQAVLVVAAQDRFGGSAEVGLLYAAAGAGGVAASLYTVRRQPARIGRTLVLGASWLEIAALALVALAPSLPTVIPLLVVCGIGGSLYPNWGSAEVQRRAPAGSVGRVSAVGYFALFAGMLAGSLGALVLVPPLGWVRALVILAAVAAVVPGLAAIGSERGSTKTEEPNAMRAL